MDARSLRKEQESLKGFQRMIRTTCGFCPAGCGLKVHISGDTIVDIWGDEEHPLSKGSVCPRASAASQLLMHPSRCIEPMWREDISSDFRRIAWEEALDRIAGKIKEVVEKHGPASVYIDLGRLSEFAGVMSAERFGYLLGTPNIDHRFPRPGGDRKEDVFSRMLGVTGGLISMNHPSDWVHSRGILMVGVDIAATQPVMMGWLLEARERGARIIGLDSHFSTTMSKTDLFIPCRPGYEDSVLASIAHCIIEKGSHNRDFLDRWTEGSADWIERCRGCPPEKVEEESWVAADKIREASRCISSLWPIQILAKDLCEWPLNEGRVLEACLGILCLTGSIGVHGGGLNLLVNFPPIDPILDLRKGGDKKEVLSRLRRDETRVPGKETLKVLITDDHSISSCIAKDGVRDPEEGPELVVQLSCFPTTARSFAHVLLPMALWPEYEGLLALGSSRCLQWHNRVVPPAGKCRTAAEFWAELAERLGWGRMFPWWRPGDEIDARGMNDFFLKQGPFTKGCTVDRIDPGRSGPGGLPWPCTGEAFTHRRFPTRSGKIEFQRIRDAGSRIEEPSGPYPSERYPLVLATGLQVNQVEGLGCWSAWLGEIDPSPFARINPETAGLLGIRNGDRVIVESAGGSIEARASVTPTVPPGLLWCPIYMGDPESDIPLENIEALGPRSKDNSRLRSLHGTPVMVSKEGTDPVTLARRLHEHICEKTREQGIRCNPAAFQKIH